MNNCEVCIITNHGYPKAKATISHLYLVQPDGVLCIDFMMMDKDSSGMDYVPFLQKHFLNFWNNMRSNS